MRRNASIIKISLLKLLKHYKILTNKNKLTIYLNHYLERVAYEQRDNEDVYHQRLYVALFLYPGLQNTNQWKIATRYPNTNLDKAIFNSTYFLRHIYKIPYFQIALWALFLKRSYFKNSKFLNSQNALSFNQ